MKRNRVFKKKLGFYCTISLHEPIFYEPIMKTTSLTKWIFIFISLIWIQSATVAETLPQFVDVTKEAGIDFVHNTGAFGEKYLPEEIASGCAFIDYDNDGWQDILLVNGKDWGGHPTGNRQTMGLYRNNQERNVHRCHRNCRTCRRVVRTWCRCR